AARGIATAEVRPDPAVAGCFTVHTASPPAMPSPLAAGAAHPDDVALLLSTSGTSGRRRLAPLTQTNLLASAFASRTLRGLEASDRCLDMMRMFHIAFVGDLLATLVAGGCAVCPPGFDGDRVFAWLEECRVTWYIAPPPIHRAILDRAPAHRAAIARGRLRFVRCASSHLTPELRQGLEAAFGVPALGGYGMTEAGPIITNELPPPAPRRLGSVGVAIGPEVEIRGDQGESLPAGEIGEIVLHGPNIFAGYLDDPAANAEAFTPDGWFRTGDLGAFDEDGHLFLHGRSQEQINRGGQKVAPQEVEAVLERHPAVAAAVAFAVPDDRLGEAVAAAIQPVAGATVDPDDVRRFAATRLAPYQTPRRIVVVEALPQTATGKRRRIGLADLLGVTTPGPVPAAVDRVPPRTALETLLAAIWAEVLGRPDIGVDDDFFATGGDSLAATRVVARIRQALGVELSVPEFFAAPTVGGLAWTVETAAGSALPGDLSRFGSDARVPSTA
ncbi:MAG: non-ribosomal peptide synthetase, partial [Chloroflexia bacterium]|nr:non-ribosomal peptide synthetase [Chloroflexia bacterium]